MKFEEIEVGKVYSAEHDVNLYLVTHKGYNYIVVINYSTVHYVAVQQFYIVQGVKTPSFRVGMKLLSQLFSLQIYKLFSIYANF